MKAYRHFQTQSDAVTFANFLEAIDYQDIKVEWIECLEIWRVTFATK